MPDMDGLEVTRRLRSGAAGWFGKAVPIVALTANAFTEDRAACLAAGMNDFLTKPVLATSLQFAVARWTARPLALADRWSHTAAMPPD
jgi:CheY-like chemotaxis protein